MQLAVLERSQRAPGATAVTLGLLPQSHIYPLVVINHACAYRGDEVVVLLKYELHNMLRAVSKHNISILFLVSLCSLPTFHSFGILTFGRFLQFFLTVFRTRNRSRNTT